MSPDPVLAAIDDTLDRHDALTESMRRNAARYNPFPGAYGPGTTPGDASVRWIPGLSTLFGSSTAVGPGWVSPPGVRYEYQGLLTQVIEDPTRMYCVRCLTPYIAGHNCTGWVWPDAGPVPRPHPSGAVPAVPTLPNDVASHRAATPLRILWAALRKKVQR